MKSHPIGLAFAALLAAASAMPVFPSEIRPVRSLLEARHQNVVIQEWDSSCGAAALATILRFQLGDPVSERDIALGILRATDPDRVRGRGGFSLLDLKRYATARGFAAEGYAGLTTGQLLRAAPAIVPVRSHRGDHFVVFRGVVNGQAVLADPAFGNRSLPYAAFEAAWKDRLAFVVRARGKDANRMLATSRDVLRVDDEASRGAMDATLPRPLGDAQLALAVAIDPVSPPEGGTAAPPRTGASPATRASAPTVTVASSGASPTATSSSAAVASPALPAISSPVSSPPAPLPVATPPVAVSVPIPTPGISVQLPALPRVTIPTGR